MQWDEMFGVPVENPESQYQGCYWEVMRYATNQPKNGQNNINIVNSYVNYCWSEASHMRLFVDPRDNDIPAICTMWTLSKSPLVE